MKPLHASTDTTKKRVSRKSPLTGKLYPKCAACQKTAYADGLCWLHYQNRPNSYSRETR